MATATRNRADRDAEKAAEYAALTAKVEETIAAIEAGDAALLADYGRLAEIYSERNALLIVAQCPTATELARFVVWQRRGRRVRHGERAIRTLDPVGGGKPDVLEYLFDVSQTDPIEA